MEKPVKVKSKLSVKQGGQEKVVASEIAQETPENAEEVLAEWEETKFPEEKEENSSGKDGEC